MLRKFILGFMSALVLATPAARAITAEDFRAAINDTVFYGTDTATCNASLTDISLSGADNTEKAFKYFLGQGLTPVQTAGILGNFLRESNMNPAIQQDKSNDPFPKDGVGFGIAQWTFTSRQQPLVDYAKSLNQPVTSLAVQLGYTWKELHSNRAGVLPKLQATTTVEDATYVWKVYFEGPADKEGKEMGLRISNAKDVLAAYNGTPTTTTAGTTGITTSGCNLGGVTKFLDGFAIFAQYDPAWKNHAYGSSTIGAAGCGPTSMAMSITALTGKTVNPVETADYATSQGMYVENVGSKWDISPTLAEHWGLKAQAIGADTSKIAATLQAGGLVITAGSGGLPFTANGHFIVIRAVTADGKFKVGDPGHSDTSDKDWDPQLLIDNMRDGSVYAITK
jgi:hypothetical protein